MNDSLGDVAEGQSEKELSGQYFQRSPHMESLRSQNGSENVHSMSADLNVNEAQMEYDRFEKYSAGNASPPSEAKQTSILQKVRKYWWKKQQRCNKKKVRYNCR